MFLLFNNKNVPVDTFTKNELILIQDIIYGKISDLLLNALKNEIDDTKDIWQLQTIKNLRLLNKKIKKLIKNID